MAIPGYTLDAIDLRYPGPGYTDSDSGMVEILIPGEYHGEEIRAGAEKGEWLALHADPRGQYRLSSARIGIERFFDPITDRDSTAPTGKRVMVLGLSDPVELLVAKSELMREARVDTVADPGKFTRNARTFRFGGMGYELEYEYSPDTTSNRKDSSWRLILSVHTDGREPTRLLLDAGMSDTEARVIFVGDLDGDDRLDLLLSSGNDSGVEDFTLYLSRPAGDRFLKAVGRLHTVAC
jgi:hypothetical protein